MRPKGDAPTYTDRCAVAQYPKEVFEKMLMSDGDIEKAVASKELVITDFSKECLQPASYDMRVGKAAFSSTLKRRIDVEKKGSVAIAPGDLILVSTYERVGTSSKVAGHIGLRSSHTRLGLVSLNGPQIDPGFEGTLTVGLCNLNSNSIELKFKEPFCTVEFFELSSPVGTSYHGPFQGQSGIRREDCDRVKAREAAWSPIEKRVGAIERKIRRRRRELTTGAALSLAIVLGGFGLLIGGLLTPYRYAVIPGVAAIAIEILRHSLRQVYQK